MTSLSIKGAELGKGSRESLMELAQALLLQVLSDSSSVRSSSSARKSLMLEA